MYFFPDVVSFNGNAKAGSDKDYKEVVQTVEFEPGQAFVEFDVAINDDDVVEHLEAFRLELQNANGARITEPDVAKVAIEDNDGN